MIVLYRTRPWRLADGVDGQGGVTARGGKMDSILAVSSGDEAGVCEVLLCSCVRGRGVPPPCLSAIFSARRKDGCITAERERHRSRRR